VNGIYRKLEKIAYNSNDEEEDTYLLTLTQNSTKCRLISLHYMRDAEKMLYSLAEVLITCVIFFILFEKLFSQNRSIFGI